MKLFALVLCVSVVLASARKAGPRCSREKISALAACAEGVKPTKTTAGCPSCLPKAFDKKKCGKAQIQACPMPGTCAAGVSPKRNGCCVTCKPAKAKCTEAQRTACATTMKSLSVCAAGTSPNFDASTCCIDCKRPARSKPERACTKEEFKTCIDTIPECGANEKPVREEGQCCMSCRRAARDAPLIEVAKCGNLPACAADETAFRVKDDSGAFVCPTCKPAKPACSPACSAKQICSWRRNKNTSTCRVKRQKNLKLKANRAADKAFLESATPEEIKAAIAEVVQRFCDKQENQAQCEKYEDTVVHNMEVLITSATAQELQVEVGLPNAVDSTRRRLGDEPADLLDSALADPDSTGSISMTEEAEQSGAQSLSITPALLACTALALALRIAY